MTYFNKMLKLHLAKAEKIVYTNEVMLHTYKGIKMNNLKQGFTLAELLIVLGIIGIIAALTMPALIASHKEKETVTRLKKAYSTLSNAYNLAIAENSTPENWDLIAQNDAQGAENLMNMLVPYLNVTKNCGRNKGCFPDVIYKNLAGANDSNYNSLAKQAKAILNDGTIFSVDVRDPACTASRGDSPALEGFCGMLYIDVNGFKSPNQNGKDIFQFYINKHAIVPRGIQGDVSAFEDLCKRNQSGYNCAGWVIHNENQDYLKCDDLSWNGKTKCK